MNDKHNMITAFLADERGAEVTELEIVLALLVAGSIVTLILIGPKVTQYYTAVNAALP
jgi:Flp pilus assembly pilin Flp